MTRSGGRGSRGGSGRGGGGRGRSAGRRGSGGAAQRYPRSLRVNEVLREVLADALEKLADTDERLSLLTVTGVECDPDLRHAVVLLDSLGEAEEQALGVARVRLQAEIGHQVRLKRTPLLSFTADPAAAAGRRIEGILRGLPHDEGGEVGR
ncbi:MAG: ribosome-binding factor A [Acidimicrobiales bacterium]